MKEVKFSSKINNELYLYEYKSDIRILSQWKGFNSDKWDNEYYPLLKKHKEFYAMPFTGSEVVLYPSIAWNLINNTFVIGTLLDNFESVNDEFNCEETFDARWKVEFDSNNLRMTKKLNMKYFRINSYEDIVKLQVCSDESLELVFFSVKEGYENSFIELLCGKKTPNHQDLSKYLNSITFTSNGFDIGCNDSISIISFSDITEDILELETKTNKNILKYEKLINSEEIEDYKIATQYLIDMR